MYSHVYGGKWSLRGVTLDSFSNFSKILIFGRSAAIFGSKLTPKCTFSLNGEAFFSVGTLGYLGLEMGVLRVV